jgi:hypothetical protein
VIEKSFPELLGTQNIEKIDIPCEEQNVLEADVSRTRGDVDEFRSSEWRCVIRDLLQNFCLSHDVQYKQGLNEVSIYYLSQIIFNNNIYHFLRIGFGTFCIHQQTSNRWHLAHLCVV